MSLSNKQLILNATKDIKHKRVRWFKIEDFHAGINRYELVYIVAKDKKHKEYVIVRRMNDEEYPKRLHMKNKGKTSCPLSALYSTKDFEWFLHYGFQSFIKYQINRQDGIDTHGAVMEATQIPSIDLSKRHYANANGKQFEIEQMKKEIEFYKQNASNFERKYNELNADNDSCDDADKNKLIDTLINERAGTMTERDDLKKKLQKCEEMKYEYEHASVAMESLQNEVNQLKDKLESAKRILNTKEESERIANQYKDQLKNEVISKIREKDTEIEILKQTIKQQQTTSKRIATLKADINAGKHMYNTLHSQHQTLDEEYTAMKQKHMHLMSEWKLLAEENNNYKETIDDLTIKNVNYSADIQANDLLMQYMREECKKQQQQHKEEYNTMQKGMNILRDERRKLKIRMAENEKTTSNFTQSLDTAHTIQSKVQKQLEETQLKYTQIVQKHEGLRGVVHALEDSKQQLNIKYLNVKRHKQALLKENERIKQSSQEQMKELKENKDNEDAQGFINMMNGNAPDEESNECKEQQVVIQRMSKQTLEKKYKILKANNLKLQKRIMELVSPSGDKSDFPVIEDIRAEFDTLRKQYCTDLFDEITNEMADQYEDDEEEDLFDAVCDRESRRVLFDLLQITYHYIRGYKYDKFDDIIDDIAAKFELKSRKSKHKMSKSMAMVINPYFQNYYTIFSRHRFMKDNGKNNKNEALKTSDMNKIIDEIYGFIKKLYAHYTFWNKQSIAKQLEVFIAKSCEFCWIMVLNTPQLYFYPRLFTQNDDDTAKRRFDANINYIYEKQKRKKKKKKKRDETDEKDEEEEMDIIVKQHEFHAFECKQFDDRCHDCLNEMDNDDDVDRIDHNGMDIAYCGWPSLVRRPQLESEQHTQITKTFAYFHAQSKQFMTLRLGKLKTS